MYGDETWTAHVLSIANVIPSSWRYPLAPANSFSLDHCAHKRRRLSWCVQTVTRCRTNFDSRPWSTNGCRELVLRFASAGLWKVPIRQLVASNVDFYAKLNFNGKPRDIRLSLEHFSDTSHNVWNSTGTGVEKKSPNSSDVLWRDIRGFTRTGSCVYVQCSCCVWFCVAVNTNRDSCREHPLKWPQSQCAKVTDFAAPLVGIVLKVCSEKPKTPPVPDTRRNRPALFNDVFRGEGGFGNSTLPPPRNLFSIVNHNVLRS